MNIAVLSAGTWGISLASLLEGNGHAVRVWEFAQAVVDDIVATGRHPKLKDFQVPTSLQLTTDMEEALKDAETIVCVVPAAHMRATCERVRAEGYAGQMFVVCTKGIEQGTLQLMHQVALEGLGPQAEGRVVTLSGPSHAEEVSLGLPTAVAVAGDSPEMAERTQALFMTPRFRVYTQSDLLGVELGAALKNVIAIACGISDGLGFGDNAKAGLITRGLSEILRLGVAMGARPESFSGLAGLGDLVVTCMSRHSRNWQFGNHIGKGSPPEEALAAVGMVVEGYYTVQAAVELAQREGVEMPITAMVAAVLFKGIPPIEAVSGLMMREARHEVDER